MKDYVFIGELSLDGKLRKVPGVLPIALEAKRKEYKGIILPIENAKEAAIVEGLDVFPFESVQEVLGFLNDEIIPQPFTMNPNEIFEQHNFYPVDFSDVKGQAEVKRGLEVAAAGGHNIIMIGLPGSGKSDACKKASHNIFLR